MQQDQSPSLPDAYTVPPETVARLGGPAQVRLLLADARARAPLSDRVEAPASVRLATIRDEPAILDLLLEDLDENATKVAAISVSRIMAQIHMGTRQKGGFVGVIDDADGQPIAVAILIPTEWWFSQSVFLQEVVLFVSSAARKGNAGRDLLQWECWMAGRMTDDLGYQIFVLAGVTATQRGSAKMRLYGRKMNQVGAFYVYPAIEGSTP